MGQHFPAALAREVNQCDHDSDGAIYAYAVPTAVPHHRCYTAAGGSSNHTMGHHRIAAALSRN